MEPTWVRGLISGCEVFTYKYLWDSGCRFQLGCHLPWGCVELLSECPSTPKLVLPGSQGVSVVPGFILASVSSSPNHYQRSPFIFFPGSDFKVPESQSVFLPSQCNHPSAQSYLIRLGFPNSRRWDKDLNTSNLSWRGSRKHWQVNTEWNTGGSW